MTSILWFSLACVSLVAAQDPDAGFGYCDMGNQCEPNTCVIDPDDCTKFYLCDTDGDVWINLDCPYGYNNPDTTDCELICDQLTCQPPPPCPAPDYCTRPLPCDQNTCVVVDGSCTDFYVCDTDGDAWEGPFSCMAGTYTDSSTTNCTFICDLPTCTYPAECPPPAYCTQALPCPAHTCIIDKDDCSSFYECDGDGDEWVRATCAPGSYATNTTTDCSMICTSLTCLGNDCDTYTTAKPTTTMKPATTVYDGLTCYPLPGGVCVEGTHYVDPEDCHNYYNCVDLNLYLNYCPQDQHYFLKDDSDQGGNCVSEDSLPPGYDCEDPCGNYPPPSS